MTSFESFVEGLLDETREEITRADTKASILLASAGVIIAVLGGAVARGDIKVTGLRGVIEVLAVGSAFTLGAGVALLGAAVLPKLGRPARGRARYFMDHAQYKLVKDLREAVEREAADPAQRHLEQLSALAMIIRRKYRLTLAGELAIGAGALLATIAAVIQRVL